MCSVYQVGYTIIEFVVRTWGFEGVRTLILEDGDPNEALSVSHDDFQTRWETFVQEEYF